MMLSSPPARCSRTSATEMGLEWKVAEAGERAKGGGEGLNIYAALVAWRGGRGECKEKGEGRGGSEMEEGLIVTTFLALSERDGWRSRMGGIRPLRN